MSAAGIGAAAGGAVAIAAVSTLGDWIWAAWLPQHRPFYGLVHGAVLFFCIGLFLGARANKRGAGAMAGVLIGVLAAASFYLLAPVAGRPTMFVVWIGVWVALGVLNERFRSDQARVRAGIARGAVAAVGSGVAFYLISGIWSPFNPRGWDYLVHFGAWTLAYLPGFAALLVARQR